MSGAWSGQDWNTVVIKKKDTNKGKTNEKSVSSARRQGQQVETEKKYGAGGNKQKGVNVNAKKLEDSEDLAHEKVSQELKIAIQQARQAKKMTQKELATAINEKPQIIADYESGRAIPNPQILQKLSRVLGVKLGGLQKKKKKKADEEDF